MAFAPSPPSCATLYHNTHLVYAYLARPPSSRTEERSRRSWGEEARSLFPITVSCACRAVLHYLFRSQAQSSAPLRRSSLSPCSPAALPRLSPRGPRAALRELPRPRPQRAGRYARVPRAAPHVPRRVSAQGCNPPTPLADSPDALPPSLPPPARCCTRPMSFLLCCLLRVAVRRHGWLPGHGPRGLRSGARSPHVRARCGCVCAGEQWRARTEGAVFLFCCVPKGSLFVCCRGARANLGVRALSSPPPPPTRPLRSYVLPRGGCDVGGTYPAEP